MNRVVNAAGLTKMAMSFVALAAIAGCVMPIPTPGRLDTRSRRAAIAEDIVVSLKPFHTTRADVLFQLGDPTERIDGDRFFVYQRTTADYLVVVCVLPDPRACFGEDVSTNHLLSLEFSPSNRLMRVGQFKGGDAWKQFLEWSESRETSGKESAGTESSKKAGPQDP